MSAVSGTPDRQEYFRRRTSTGKLDPRVLTLVVFQKLHQELSEIEGPLTYQRAASLIRRSINHLPGYRAEKGSNEHILVVTNEYDPENVLEMNIRDAIDSLMIVWNDFRELMDRL